MERLFHPSFPSHRLFSTLHSASLSSVRSHSPPIPQPSDGALSRERRCDRRTTEGAPPPILLSKGTMGSRSPLTPAAVLDGGFLMGMERMGKHGARFGEAPRRRHVGILGVGREVIDIAIPASTQQDGIARVAFELTRD